MPILPGKYEIKSLSLLSSEGRGVLDLLPYFKEINIFESIYSSCLTGFVSISDPTNMISGIVNSLPIMGNERIILECNAPDFFFLNDKEEWEGPYENNIFYTGRVTDIKNRELTESERTQSYEIHFCSEELVKDRNIKISKSYKNKSIWEIVRSIFSEFNSDFSIQYEKTLYTQSFIIPNWNPLKTINWLVSRSLSVGYGTGPYFFYQTLYKDNDLEPDSTMVEDTTQTTSSKYWFVSLDYLLSWDKRKTIFFIPSNIMRPDPKDPETYMSFSNALNYEIVHSFDTLENNYYGMFNSRNIIHDITKKQWTKVDYKYNDAFDRYQHAEKENSKGKIFDGVKDTSGNTFSDYTSSVLMLNSYGTYENPNYLDKISSERNSRLKTLNNFKIRLLIPGDGLIESGDVIEFKFPSPETDGGSKYDEFYDGNYLVTAIRHTFKGTEAQDYTMTLECAKETLKQEVRGYQPK